MSCSGLKGTRRRGGWSSSQPRPRVAVIEPAPNSRQRSPLSCAEGLPEGPQCTERVAVEDSPWPWAPDGSEEMEGWVQSSDHWEAGISLSLSLSLSVSLSLMSSLNPKSFTVLQGFYPIPSALRGGSHRSTTRRMKEALTWRRGKEVFCAVSSENPAISLRSPKDGFLLCRTS